MSLYVVKVIQTDTGEVVNKISCGYSERKAEKVLEGVLINLHDDYHVEIEEIQMELVQ